MDDETTPNPMTALLDMVDSVMPLFEAFKGLRECLEADGRSPTAAEELAVEWGTAIMRKMR